MKLMKLISLAASMLMAGIATASAADIYSGTNSDRVNVAPSAVYDDWNGGYIGGLIGWNWVNADGTTSLSNKHFPVYLGHDFDLDDNNVAGGIQLGGDQQYGNAVVGIVLDHRFTDLEVSGSAGEQGEDHLAYSAQAEVSGLGSARLRGGLLVSPKDLVYVTGGVAWGIVDTSSRLTYDFGPWEDDLRDSDDEFKIGWTIGAGYETKGVLENTRVKIEYLYTDLGDVETSISLPYDTDLKSKADLTFHTVQIGVAYEF